MKNLILSCLIFISVSSVGQKVDTTYYLKFSGKGLINLEEGYDFNNQTLKNEFILWGEFPMKCSVEIINNDESVILKYVDNNWQTVDSIEQMFINIDNDDDEITLPAFRIEDFNKDGNQDLICQTRTNINGNEWVQIYLNDPKTKTLIKIPNTAEGNFTWDAPEYNAKDSTIHCTKLSSNFGLSFESKYKLEGFNTIPIEKDERDNTNLNPEGKGGILRYYIGNKGKWKLKQKIKS